MAFFWPFTKKLKKIGKEYSEKSSNLKRFRPTLRPKSVVLQIVKMVKRFGQTVTPVSTK